MNIASRVALALKVLAGYHLQKWNPDRPFRVDQSQSARKEINYAVRSSLLSWARDFEKKDAIFNRFLDLCEQYVAGPTGLRIASGSSDREWAQAANAEWEGWCPYCDISSRFSFGQRNGLMVREQAVAGELFILLTYGDSGRPRLQFMESEQCKTPSKLMGEEGKTIFDGVQLDSTGRPLFYYFSDKPTPADSVIHLFDPSRFGQTRGLTVLYPVLKDMLDLEQLQDLEMLAAKDAAKTSKVIKTEQGELTAQQVIGVYNSAPAGEAATYYQQVLGSESVIMRPGDSYEQFASNRPSVAVQEFWRLVMQRQGAGMGLPLEILIMSSLQGTMTRAALDMANGFFRCRTANLAEGCARVWEYVIGNNVALRRNRPADWRKIRYTPPRAINVDVGRNSAALIAEWRAGFRTLESIAAETGNDWREIIDQRDIELIYAAEKDRAANRPEGTIMQLQQPGAPASQPATA